MELNKIYNKTSEVAFRKVSDEYILVPLSDDIADMDSLFTMNEVGAFIWEQIDGNRSISQIVENVTDEFDVENETAKKDVFTFLDEIKNFLK